MKNELIRCTPEQVGIPSAAIESFLDGAAKAGIELHSIMLLRHGKVCAEGWWKPYGPEYVHPMYSFSKSLTSTAIGFAVQEGLLSLSDRLIDIFPEKAPKNPCANLQKCTVRDLLIMGCGHKEELRPAGEDWIRAFMEHPFEYEPGTMFQYNTLGTNLLCAILARKSGQQLTAFLRPRLFDVIGIGDVRCKTMPDGTEAGGAGYRLRTEDMARFMQFVLQKGVWEGRRILNEEWFDMATSKQIETDNPVYGGKEDWGVGYGFQFWRCQPEGVYRADGLYGQFGIALPEKEFLLLITEATGHTQTTLDLVWEHLLSALAEGELPENQPAAAHLRHRLQSLTLAELHANKMKPWDSALQYGNREFASKEESYFLLDDILSFMGGECAGLKSLSFDFTEHEAVLTLTEEGGVSQIPIGLDGEYTYSVYRGEKCAAMGRFRSHTEFEAEFRGVETPDGLRVIFRFGEHEVTVMRAETLLGYGNEEALPDLHLTEVLGQ